MKLDLRLFNKVKEDLESKGAEVVLRAYVVEKDVDYTIFATFLNGSVWEILKIIEE